MANMNTTQMIVRHVLLAALLSAALAGCGAQGMGGLSGIGASALNSAGFNVSAGDLDAAFRAGDAVAGAARGFSPEQEYYLGRGVSAVMLSRYRPIQNAPLNRYVNKVGLVLAGYSDRPSTFGGYHFLVLDTDEVNAFAAPGGYVFLTRGFLRLVPDEDALAAVLAHEIAHVVKGHGTAAISQAKVTAALTQLGKQAAASQGGEETQLLTETFGDSIKDVTDTLLTKGYSRSQEYDADEYAAVLLQRAGYDPAGLAAMLQALAGQSKNSSGGWFSTHPDAEKRAAEVKEDLPTATAAVTAGRTLRATRYQAAVRGTV